MLKLWITIFDLNDLNTEKTTCSVVTRTSGNMQSKHVPVQRIKPFFLVTRSHYCISIAECRRKLHHSLYVVPMTHALLDCILSGVQVTTRLEIFLHLNHLG